VAIDTGAGIHCPLGIGIRSPILDGADRTALMSVVSRRNYSQIPGVPLVGARRDRRALSLALTMGNHHRRAKYTSTTAPSAARIHQNYAPTKSTHSRTPTNWARSLTGR
jgi:hypothetical protein